MDIHAIALNGLKSALGAMRQDIEAVPDDVWAKNLGGKARSAADIVYEVCLVNDHFGLTLRGEPLFDWPDGWVVAPEEWRSKADALPLFDASVAKILATIESFPADSMETKVQTEHGETDRFERCRFMTLHAWYHSGQLNYIQTLAGDDAWHWN